MTNDVTPPPGEVKHPKTNPPANAALVQAARSLQRCRLPAQADATIAQAADDLERLLSVEGIRSSSGNTDALLLAQSAVLDNLFHHMVAAALTPGESPAENMLNLALRSQKLCNGTITGIHKRREIRNKSF